MSKPVISLKNISYQYAGQNQKVLQQFSLDIHPGSITAILGPNGSGKTTLLHIILGHLTPTDGVVYMGQRPRQHLSKQSIGKRIGLVSQDEYIPFNFTVLEYVLLGRAPYLHFMKVPSQHDVDLAYAALQKLKLNEFTHTHIQSLSGGERQLVMIARALVQNPEIFLLDEPTSHLDLRNKQDVLALLRILSTQNATIVFTSQDPATALAIAEYAVLMYKGTTLASGSIKDVMTAANLSATYGVDVEVYEVAGKRVILEK